MPRHELNVFQYPHNLRTRVKLVRRFPDRPILADNKDVDQYVGAVFDGASADDIYVRDTVRPRGGLGAHFDVYNRKDAQLLHEDYPFIATFNTVGKTVLCATALSEALQHGYDANYPDLTIEAHAARRILGNYALSNPNATIYTHAGELAENSGIIIPQVPDGPYVVHEVMLSDTTPFHDGFSEFLKFAVPADTDEARDALQMAGFGTYANHQAELARQKAMREAHQAWADKIADRYPDPDDFGGFIDDDFQFPSNGPLID